ncbi:SLATT domain-containing protein [Cellulomonas sp. T2.31MG-18]|uniref:SLATT domain-containing protein n=1 Tax=Cellulomonas sp. T2.31MG-18 TaxID=3157619 RepID=UPI00366CF81E
MAAPSDSVDRLRDAVRRELEDIAEDVLWTEKAHFAHAHDLHRVNLWLGLTSTVAASIAAATVVAKIAPVLTGIAAVIAAITSGLLTFLQPRDTEKRHLDAARKLGALRVKAREAVRLDLSPAFDPDPSKWRSIVDVIATEKSRIDSESPGISDRAFERARAKIEAGHFDHESDQH